MIIASHELDQAEGLVVNAIPYPPDMRRRPPGTPGEEFDEYVALLAQGIHVLAPEDGWWG